MERWKQYGGLLGLLSAGLLVGFVGFTSTGGSIPWAKRSAKSLQRGVQEGSGQIIDLGRGIVIAGPIRNGGLVVEFGVLVTLLALFGVGLYVYVDRYSDQANDERTV